MSKELENKIVEITTESNRVLDENQKFIIKGDKSLEQASAQLVAIKARIKRSEELRTFFVKPLNDQVKAINEKFRLAIRPFMDADTLITGKILDYRRKENARIAEENRLEAERQRLEFEAEQLRLKAEAKKLKGIEKEMAVAEIPKEFVPEPIIVQKKSIATSAGTLKTRKTWKAIVVDENIIPREYLSVDMVKLNSAVRSGVRVIAGVSIEQVETLN